MQYKYFFLACPKLASLGVNAEQIGANQAIPDTPIVATVQVLGNQSKLGIKQRVFDKKSVLIQRPFQPKLGAVPSWCVVIDILQHEVQRMIQQNFLPRAAIPQKQINLQRCKMLLLQLNNVFVPLGVLSRSNGPHTTNK